RSAERPDDAVGPADQVAGGDHAAAGRAEAVARVAGGAAVVAEDHQAALGHPHAEGPRGGGATGGPEPRLVDRPSVNPDPPLLVAADHAVPAHPDDALDEVAVAEMSGSVEHHHVAALRRGSETVCQLVYENTVPDPQSRLHRAAGDL